MDLSISAEELRQRKILVATPNVWRHVLRFGGSLADLARLWT